MSRESSKDEDDLTKELKFQADLASGKFTIDVKKLLPSLEKIHTSGVDRGLSTGWRNLDPLYRVRKGEMAIVTGIPGSGKSSFVDCLAMSLAQKHDWKFSLFSPENKPYQLHLRKLVEIHAGESLYKEEVIIEDEPPKITRMDSAKLAKGLQFCSEHFHWVDLPAPTLASLMEVWYQHIDKYKLDGLILDPWNEIEHATPKNMSETQYISFALSIMREFARLNQIALWIVAHPAKISRNKDGNFPVPSLNDIAGSYAWRAKADIGIVVHRESSVENVLDILVQKVRFKTSGKPGHTKLNYDYDCGRMYT